MLLLSVTLIDGVLSLRGSVFPGNKEININCLFKFWLRWIWAFILRLFVNTIQKLLLTLRIDQALKVKYPTTAPYALRNINAVPDYFLKRSVIVAEEERSELLIYRLQMM